MAEEPHQSTPTSEEESKNPKDSKPKRRSSGFFSRFFKAIFGSGNEDFEKKLQYLSKEEASVHARLKRRARSSRKKARNIIVVSVVLEITAVVYAVMTTRSVNLDWKMRASRVFPMFVLPILSTLVYSTLVSFTRMLDRKDQKTLERLRAERQAKIDELKERTNYYTTQQLIQRYDLDPAAKAAAATVLASKLGADSGLKVYLGDESNPKASFGRSNDAELVDSTGLRNRKPSNIRSCSPGNAARTPLIDETSTDYSSDGQEVSEQNQRLVERYKGSSLNDGGWLARIAALLVGEDPTQCYALICGNCHMHNGLARKEDFLFITYYCPHCHALNGSKQSGDDGPSISPEQATPTAPCETNTSVSSDLATVQELPELPTGDENDGKGDAQAS